MRDWTLSGSSQSYVLALSPIPLSVSHHSHTTLITAILSFYDTLHTYPFITLSTHTYSSIAIVEEFSCNSTSDSAGIPLEVHTASHAAFQRQGLGEALRLGIACLNSSLQVGI